MEVLHQQLIHMQDNMVVTVRVQLHHNRDTAMQLGLLATPAVTLDMAIKLGASRMRSSRNFEGNFSSFFSLNIFIILDYNSYWTLTEHCVQLKASRRLAIHLSIYF